MQKAWWHTNQLGISLVEVLLAITVFGMLVAAVGGSIMYGQTSTNSSANRQQANLIAEEGLEAVRNIRDSGFSNLTDGTYGLAQVNNQWTLTANPDISGNFTRQISIHTSNTNRKDVTSKVTWTQGGQGGTSETTLVTRLTHWFAAVAKSWTKPGVEASMDASGTNNATKVDTQGNYVYLVRNDGAPDFLIYDISTPATPILAGSLSLTGTPTNVFVAGNYAYVTNTNDSAELNIINISNPTAPSVVGNYNASGTADGKGVFASGNYAYLVRAANSANNEFVVINIATPSTPVRVGGYNLNITMNEVYVNGAAAYVATGSDTQEVLVINLSTLSSPTLGTSINLPGTTDAATIAGMGNSAVIGQGTAFHTASLTVALAPVLSGSLTLSGTINDLDLDNGPTYAWAGTSATSAELQVINIGNFGSPALAGTVDLSSAAILSGVSYSISKDRVAGAASIDTQEFVLFNPN